MNNKISNRFQFSKMTDKQKLQLLNIKSVTGMGLTLYPCSVILINGEKKECVYIVEVERYNKIWGTLPKETKLISIQDVVEIQPSNLRLPPIIAQKIYDEGESGMGYYVFALKFNDGTTQTYLTGDAIDFVPLPERKTMSDIIDVELHKGRNDPNRKVELDYYWCLYNE